MARREEGEYSTSQPTINDASARKTKPDGAAALAQVVSC
jgi:hypothetical protein